MPTTLYSAKNTLPAQLSGNQFDLSTPLLVNKYVKSEQDYFFAEQIVTKPCMWCHASDKLTSAFTGDVRLVIKQVGKLTWTSLEKTQLWGSQVSTGVTISWKYKNN